MYDIMATRTIYEVDYEFKNYGDYEIDTEICGKNDEGGL